MVWLGGPVPRHLFSSGSSTVSVCCHSCADSPSFILLLHVATFIDEGTSCLFLRQTTVLFLAVINGTLLYSRNWLGVPKLNWKFPSCQLDSIGTMATGTVTETEEAIPLPQRPNATQNTTSNTTPPEITEKRSSFLHNRDSFKLLSVGFSFFVAGINDGSIGALLPYVIREYNINTAIVSSL